MPIRTLLLIHNNYTEFVRYVHSTNGNDKRQTKITLTECLHYLIDTQQPGLNTGVVAWISMLTLDYESAVRLILRCADEIDAELIFRMRNDFNIRVCSSAYSDLMTPEKYVVVYTLVINMFNHWNFLLSPTRKVEKAPLIKRMLSDLLVMKIIDIETDAKGCLEITLHHPDFVKTSYTSLKFYSHTLKSELFDDDGSV